MEDKLEYPQRGGSVLITSRRQGLDFWDANSRIIVTTFSSQESETLIKNITHQEDLKSIKTLSEALGKLPLAINNASHYIAEEGLTIKEYLKELSVQNSLLKQQPENRRIESPPKAGARAQPINRLVDRRPVVGRQLRENGRKVFLESCQNNDSSVSNNIGI